MILPQLWDGERSRLSDILSQRVLEYAGQPCEKLLTKEFPLFFEAQAIYFASSEIEKKGLLKLETKNDTFGPDVQALYARLLNAMAQQRALSSDEISDLVARSIELQLDCLVRPRQTLFERLYNNAEELEKEDVLMVVRAFGEERPFILHLMKSVETFDTDILLQVDFVSLATAAEKTVYKNAPVSAFLTDVDLLLKFEESVTGESQFVLKSDILLGLLKERGLSGMAQAIEEEAKGKEFWTQDEVENAMDRVILIGGFDEQPVETVEEGTPAVSVAEEDPDEDEGLDFRLPDTISIEDLDFVKRVRAKRDADTSQMELNIKFAERNNSEDETDQISVASETVEEANPIIHIPVNEEEEDKSYPEVRSDIPSFTKIMSDEDHRVLLAKIFHGDRDQFDEFVATLDDAGEWKEARNLIEQELDKRNIDPRSEEAVLLGDLVFARYYSDS